MNSTPPLVQGCMVVVSLSLILRHTFHRRPMGRCGCGNMCRPKLRGGSVPTSAQVRGMAGMGIIGVCLLLEVCAVVLALLLIAGDVEENPGPTGKEGINNGRLLVTCRSICNQDQQFKLIGSFVPLCLIFSFLFNVYSAHKHLFTLQATHNYASDPTLLVTTLHHVVSISLDEQRSIYNGPIM